MTTPLARRVADTLHAAFRRRRDAARRPAVPGCDRREAIETRLRALSLDVRRIVDDPGIPARGRRLLALGLAVDDVMVSVIADAGFGTSTLHVPLSAADRAAVTAYLRHNGWPEPPHVPGNRT